MTIALILKIIHSVDFENDWKNNTQFLIYIHCCFIYLIDIILMHIKQLLYAYNYNEQSFLMTVMYLQYVFSLCFGLSLFIGN